MFQEIIFSPYTWTIATLLNVFNVWSFYDQRMRKIPLNKLDYYTRLHVDNLLPARRDEIIRRGYVIRKEILELNRIILIDITERKEGKLQLVGGTKKQNPGPFNPSAFTADDQGNMIQCMRNVLDEKYMNRPPQFIDDGVLPPVDYDLSEAFFSVLLASVSYSKLSVIERLFHPSEAKARIDNLIKISNTVIDCAMKNRESLAAFHRVLNSWTESGKVPGFLLAIKQAVDYRSKHENHG